MKIANWSSETGLNATGFMSVFGNQNSPGWPQMNQLLDVAGSELEADAT